MAYCPSLFWRRWSCGGVHEGYDTQLALLEDLPLLRGRGMEMNLIKNDSFLKSLGNFREYTSSFWNHTELKHKPARRIPVVRNCSAGIGCQSVYLCLFARPIIWISLPFVHLAKGHPFAALSFLLEPEEFYVSTIFDTEGQSPTVWIRKT